MLLLRREENMTSEANSNSTWLADDGFSTTLPGTDPFETRSNTEGLHPNSTDDEEFMKVIRFHETAVIFVPAIFALLFVLGVVANFLVVYVTIVTNRTAKHPIHSIFVLNLAVADVLFLVVSAPYWITTLTVPKWIFGAFLCPVIPFISTTTVASSIYTICALAWIRFMALVMPFRFRRSFISTRKAGYVVVIAIWIAGAILSLPYLFYYRAESVDGAESAVACMWVGPKHAHNVYSIVKLAANYIFPLLMVTFFYVIVGREVLCYMMHRNSTMNRGPSDEHKECIKSTVVVLSLILVFLICWLPHLLETVFPFAGVLSGKEHALHRVILGIVGKTLAYAHAFVNPFIYTFASPIFRRNLRTSFREKMRNCRNENSLCARRRAASAVRRRRNNKGRHAQLAVATHQDCESAQTYNLTGNSNHDVTTTTPRSERLRTQITTDSQYYHPTEITRQTSPELSNGGHCVQTTLAAVQKSDEEDGEIHPMLSREESNDNTQENAVSKIGEKDSAL